LNWMKTQISDSKALKESIDKIFNEYDFNGVFMAHGTTLSPYGELDVHKKFLDEWNKILPK
jgi:flagellin-like hook-associated protein FlgL